MLVASIKAPLEPIFILRAIGGNPQDLGFAEAAWGLGMLLGAVAAPVAARHWHRVRLLPVGLVAIGVCVLVASTATTLFPVLLLWLVAGGGNGLVTVSYESLLQETTPDHLRGRVVAGSEAVLDSAIICGALLAGWLGSTYGARGAYMIAGVTMIGVGLLARVMLAPAGRRAREERPAPASSVAPPVTVPSGGRVQVAASPVGAVAQTAASSVPPPVTVPSGGRVQVAASPVGAVAQTAASSVAPPVTVPSGGRVQVAASPVREVAQTAAPSARGMSQS